MDSYWWCVACLNRVEPCDVTYHEWHDGCGGKCVTRAEGFDDEALTLRARLDEAEMERAELLERIYKLEREIRILEARGE